MHILLTTYGLLLIFVLYCSAQWRSATDMAFMDTVAIERFSEAREQSLVYLNKRSKELYYKNNPTKAAKTTAKATNSKVDSTKAADTSALIKVEEEEESEFADIPGDEEPAKKVKNEKCSSFLFIGDMFRGENPSITEGKGKDAFTLLKNLLAAMYEGQEFYEDAKEQMPDLEERFLLTLYEKAKEAQQEKQWLKATKNLDKLDLEDNLLTHIRYKTFNGNKSRFRKNSNQAGYFPLIEMASMKTHDTLMSIWLAPKPLLMALFQNPDVVQDVIEARREIFNDLQKDSSDGSKQTKEQELRLRFGAYIHDVDVKYIDFRVSGSRPPDMPKGKKQKTANS